jgi:hypothetical protein
VTCEAWCDGALARGPSAPGPIRDGPGPGNETTGHGHDRHWVCQGEHHRSGPFDSGSRAQGGRLPGHPAEKRSGTTTEGREALRTVLEFLHAGDVLMVTLIDRLARSIGDLHDIVRTVRTRGAVLKATDQPLHRRGGRNVLPGHARRLRRVRDQPTPRAPAGRHRQRRRRRASTRAGHLR